jgi:glycosyltransferase involved in cell wall biosynthesis
LEAFVSHARTLFASWRLMIVGPTKSRFGGGGDSYLQSLQKMADQAKDQVTFTGPIFDPALLEENFRAARLFVYPSVAESGESFGLAPLEAMTHGCAVLVSNLDCFHDFVREAETGFLFDHRSNDPSATLQEKIENIIANETLLARVAEQGYRKSLEYSVARVADQFLNDFQSIARKSHGGTS